MRVRVTRTASATKEAAKIFNSFIVVNPDFVNATWAARRVRGRPAGFDGDARLLNAFRSIQTLIEISRVSLPFPVLFSLSFVDLKATNTRAQTDRAWTLEREDQSNTNVFIVSNNDCSWNFLFFF